MTEKKRSLGGVLLTLGGLFLSLACQADAPQPTTILARPDPKPVAEAFLSAWEEGNYTLMYDLLSNASTADLDPEEFAQRYQEAWNAATVIAFSASPGQATNEGDRATVDLTLHLQTVLLGEYEVVNTLPLIWEEGWKIEWSPGLIYPGLEGENRLYVQRLRPSRASIYARDGQPLAIDGVLVTVGVVPGEIQDESRLLTELSRILGPSAEEIQDKYRAPGVQPDWFVPIGDISFEKSLEEQSVLSSIPGVALREKRVRTYPQGAMASHIVGYVGEIDEAELADYLALGYESGDIVGRAGLEKWGEAYLAGWMGGVLSVITPEGQVVQVLREFPAQPSRSIYTSIDLTLQKVAEEALGERRGAVVAIDPRSGEILAMASYPDFDPNQIVSGLNVKELFNDPSAPLLNRATQGALPTGSVFKIITTLAALEGPGFDPSVTVFCPGYWLAPWGRRYLDWKAHGTVDFRQAIIQSSSTFFYEIGFRLDNIDPWLLPTWAKNFGLGQATGILGVPPEQEEPGLVPDPDWKECCFSGEGNPFWGPGDAVNLAVGQGDLKVTPLQAANFIATIANGGTLYRPRLVLSAGGPPGNETIDFRPEVMGTISLSPENLLFIQDALHGVTVGPLGTARGALQTLPYPVAGKTGTAESVPGQKPHAWFLGYAPADDPQIAVAVVLENFGEGALYAAPVFRQVVEAYFAPPESITPTPEPTPATLAPTATPTALIPTRDEPVV